MAEARRIREIARLRSSCCLSIARQMGSSIAAAARECVACVNLCTGRGDLKGDVVSIATITRPDMTHACIFVVYAAKLVVCTERRGPCTFTRVSLSAQPPWQQVPYRASRLKRKYLFHIQPAWLLPRGPSPREGCASTARQPVDGT